jgi:prepilin-type N-terminal cleavage/methylation domain-containing protein
MRNHRAHRPAFTLVELSLVMTIIGLLTLLAGRQLMLLLDRIAARAAVAEAATVILHARDEAMAQRAMTSVQFDTVTATLELRVRGGLLNRVALGHAHGVTLSSNRDSLAFDVRGLGYGAANLTMIARRGRAAETLVVSRLGRVRY